MRAIALGLLIGLAGMLGGSAHAPPLSAAAYACTGCSMEKDSYAGQPPVVQWVNEPALKNGTCRQHEGCKQEHPCEVDGTLRIKNISPSSLWIDKDGAGGAGETMLASGASTDIDYNNDIIGCGFDIYVRIYDEPPGTPRLEIAYYWMDCTMCEEN